MSRDRYRIAGAAIALAIAIGSLAFGLRGQGPNLPVTAPGLPQGADTTPRYQAIDSKSLSAASETLTVQQQAAPNGVHNVVFENAWVYCSVACSFTISQNGTAATGTTTTPSALNTSPASSVTEFKASNVGTGAYVSAAYQLAAGAMLAVDLSKFYLTQNGGSGQNLSIVSSSITGNIQITVQWIEK